MTPHYELRQHAREPKVTTKPRWLCESPRCEFAKVTNNHCAKHRGTPVTTPEPPKRGRPPGQARPKLPPMDPVSKLRLCVGCEKLLAATLFNASNKGRDGLQGRCRKCQRKGRKGGTYAG